MLVAEQSGLCGSRLVAGATPEMASPSTLRRRLLRSRRLAFLRALEAGCAAKPATASKREDVPPMAACDAAPAAPVQPPPGLEAPRPPCKEVDPVASLTRQVRELRAEIVKLHQDGSTENCETRVQQVLPPCNVLDWVCDVLISPGRQGQSATVDCIADWALDTTEDALQAAAQLCTVQMRNERVIDWVISVEGDRIVFPGPEEWEAEESAEEVDDTLGARRQRQSGAAWLARAGQGPSRLMCWPPLGAACL